MCCLHLFVLNRKIIKLGKLLYCSSTDGFDKLKALLEYLWNNQCLIMYVFPLAMLTFWTNSVLFHFFYMITDTMIS